MERVKKIISEELIEYKNDIDLVEFHNYNEPFLDFKLFYELASYVKSFLGKYKVGVVTNGSIMDKQIALSLIELRLQHLFFSVDGFSKEVYERQRVGLNRDEVYSNINMFCETSQIQGGIIPLISFTVTEKNKHEIECFKDYWQARRINISIQGCDGRGGLDKEPVFSKNCIDGPCTYALDGIYILSNLDVVPCCLDWSGKAVMGNLGKQSLKEILEGDKYDLFRQLHLAWRKNEIPLCKDCKTHMAYGPGKGSYFGYLEHIREG